MTTARLNLFILILLCFMSVFMSIAEETCTPEEMTQEHLQKLAIANNDLALKLHRKIAATSSENVFFSPFSISTAFSMLLYGARDDTAEELRDILSYEKADMPDDLIHLTFNTFLTQVLKEGSLDAYVLKSANAILVDKQLELIPEFKSEVQDMYQASVQDVDFVKNGEKVVDEINQWVKDKTNGKIDQLLDELSPSTILVLLNAVYFKGTWRLKFKPEKTRDQPFYNNGLESDAKEVPFMHMSARLHHAAMSDFQALELFYKGENISMLILLPDQRDGLLALVENLSLEKLSEISETLKQKKIILSLPKFKVQYSHEFSGEIKALGGDKIFQSGSADFSGMTPSKNVFVSQVLHKAVVEVNEEGSEAAVVTGVVTNRMRPIMELVPEFRANHPFLFFILERGSGSNMILFMGHINSL